MYIAVRALKDLRREMSYCLTAEGGPAGTLTKSGPWAYIRPYGIYHPYIRLYGIYHPELQVEKW